MDRAERERLRGLIGALQGDAIGYGVTSRADLLRRVDEHRAALEAGIERLERERETLATAVRVMQAESRSDRGNAPGHAHLRQGIWDDDNGDKSGKPCKRCSTWNAALHVLSQDSTAAQDAREGKR